MNSMVDLDVLDEQYGLKTGPVRENTQYSRLENFVVDVPILYVSKNENEVQELRHLVVELSDHFHAEMENRFAIASTSLWSSLGVFHQVIQNFAMLCFYTLSLNTC